MFFDKSFNVCSMPPFIDLEPKLGCLTPRAAPNILLPGSPILGAGLIVSELAERIAGSFKIDSSAKTDVEESNESKVGWEGSDGRVGDGSRPVGADVYIPLPFGITI